MHITAYGEPLGPSASNCRWLEAAELFTSAPRRCRNYFRTDDPDPPDAPCAGRMLNAIHGRSAALEGSELRLWMSFHPYGAYFLEGNLERDDGCFAPQPLTDVIMGEPTNAIVAGPERYELVWRDGIDVEDGLVLVAARGNKLAVVRDTLDKTPMTIEVFEIGTSLVSVAPPVQLAAESPAFLVHADVSADASGFLLAFWQNDPRPGPDGFAQMMVAMARVGFDGRLITPPTVVAQNGQWAQIASGPAGTAVVYELTPPTDGYCLYPLVLSIFDPDTFTLSPPVIFGSRLGEYGDVEIHATRDGFQVGGNALVWLNHLDRQFFQLLCHGPQFVDFDADGQVVRAESPSRDLRRDLFIDAGVN